MVTGSSKESDAVFCDADIVTGEQGLASMVTEEADGEKGVLGEASEDMGHASSVREAWELQLASVGGADGVAVGHLDVDGSVGGCFVVTRAGDEEIVSCGVSVGNG